MKLTYLGHASFLLEGNGSSIVFDPYEEGSVPGLHFPEVFADLVLCSHAHHDHNAVSQVHIKEPADFSMFKITTLSTEHDANGGKDRGLNTVHIVEVENEKIVHLGDLGRPLKEEEIEELKNCSVLLIPCGGFYTIDRMQAHRIVEQLKPRTTVLMHFRTGAIGYDVLADLEDIKNEFTALQLKEEALISPFPEGIFVLKPKQD